MRLPELEEMAIEEPSEAEAAIAELVSNSDVEQLVEVARAARVPDLRDHAINALGDIGGSGATAALIEMLEQASTDLFVGGTEQKREHERKKERLVHAVARARGVPPPGGRSQPEIAEFIEACRGADEPTN
jgi:hypothetical protein